MAERRTVSEIAFIGLGRMGAPMASRLAGAGFHVHCGDRSPSAVKVARDAGLACHDDPLDAVSRAEMVITMLPNGAVVRDFMLGETAAARSMRPSAFLVDMSSSAPAGTKDLGKSLSELGIGMVDAPVSGGVARAIEGKITIMAGGDPRLIDIATPAFEAMGSQIFRTGALGNGHAAKALNNYVSAAGLAAACEALIVAERFGLDGDVLVDVLNGSTGRNNSTEVKLKPYILSGSFGSGFAMALMSKDLNAANDLAETLGANQSGMAWQAALWAKALEQLGQDADHTEIYRFLDRGTQD